MLPSFLWMTYFSAALAALLIMSSFLVSIMRFQMFLVSIMRFQMLDEIDRGELERRGHRPHEFGFATPANSTGRIQVSEKDILLTKIAATTC
jgi:hypothetical protein